MLQKQIYVSESSFESMVEENAYLVDKTRYIKSIFKYGNSVSLITRPRRFGKSLTQSMLLSSTTKSPAIPQNPTDSSVGLKFSRTRSSAEKISGNGRSSS